MAVLDQSLLTRSHQVSPPQADEAKSRIQVIWQQNLPLLRTRLDLLAAAADGAKAHTLTGSDREEAISIAHKLAGSLGMFGFPEGSALALQLEAALQAIGSEPETLTQLAAELRATLHLAA